MKTFLSSSIAILVVWLASIPMMADNYSSGDPETQTYVLPGQAFKILPQQGFCFYDNQGRGSLTTTDQFAVAMEDLRITFNIANSTLPELKGTSSEAYSRIASYISTFEKRVEDVLKPIDNLKNELSSLDKKTTETESKLANYQPSSKKAGTTSEKAGLSLHINANSNNDGNHFDFAESGSTARAICQAYYWYDDLESKIRYALIRENEVLKALGDWCEEVVSEYQPLIDSYNSRLSAINDKLEQGMDADELAKAASDCSSLWQEIYVTRERLEKKSTSIVWLNPWATLYAEAKDYYDFLENQTPLAEETLAQLGDAIETALQNNLPEAALGYASENGNELRIPSEVEVNGETVPITCIAGAIIPNTEATRTEAMDMTIVIPKTVERLEGNCFVNPVVKYVIMENPEPPYQEGVRYYEWSNTTEIRKEYCPFMLKEENDAILYVPAEALESYQKSLWSYYFNQILPISDSAVDNIISDPNDEISSEIYNLNGIKVGNSTEGLGKGIYIVKRGNRTSKIMIP